VTPTRPTLRDVIAWATRDKRLWTWCEGCGAAFPLSDYVLHLQLVAAGFKHKTVKSA
jgi:hypothetical protein